MSSDVRRASHTQYVPQVGRPQKAPEKSAMKAISAPVGAIARASMKQMRLLRHRPMALKTAIST